MNGPNDQLTSTHQWIRDELDRLKRSGLLRTLRRVDSGPGPRVVIDGRDFILMAGNNYLGLAGHPAVRKAAIQAIEEYGVGSGASRLISGNTSLHEQLENRLARFKQSDAALIFNSGYTANLSLIPCLIPEKAAGQLQERPNTRRSTERT